MQHVLRCWERQSDGSEYKKTFRRPGLCPGPRSGSLQRSHKRPSWWGGAGCPLPDDPIIPLSALRASLLLPHSKISSDADGGRVAGARHFAFCMPFVSPNQQRQNTDEIFQLIQHTYGLSLCFIGHFTGERGLASVIGAKDGGGGGDNWGYISSAKLQSNHHHQQTSTQLFTGRMPFLSSNQQCQILKELVINSQHIYGLVIINY